MKKLAFIIAIVCTFSVLSSCNPTGGGGGTAGTADFEFETEKFKGKTLTIWQNWEYTDTYGELALFQEKTGATVKYEMIPYGTASDGSDYYNKISTAIVSGTGPDACYLWQMAVPSWTRSGLLLPWDDLINMDTEPFKSKINAAVTEFYTYNGKKYGLMNNDELNFYWVYYDKQMFSDSGLEDPYDLFRAGQWTWDKMMTMGQALTYDSDNDKTIDKYGFGGYATDGWLASNGANYVKFTDGKPIFALSDPEAIAAMEQERDVFMKIKPYSEIGESDEKNFINGNVAMYYEGTFSIKTLKEAKGDNLGCVPMPTGPNFDKSKTTAVEINAVPLFICNTCKEKELLAHYVTYLYSNKGNEADKEQKTIDEAFLGDKELYEFYKELKQYGWIPNDISFGRLPKLLQLKVLWNYDETPTKLVQSVVNLAQGEIDDVFYGTGE